MRGAHDACTAVDRCPVEIFVSTLDGTYMHAASHLERNATGRLRIAERPLQLERRIDRVERIVEGSMDAVSGRFYDKAAIPLNRRASDRIVACQRMPHPLGFLLPESGAALDVGKEKSAKRAGIGHAGTWHRW
jgi:hypothetical protein